ncbi:bifunctional DNA primase/polymerase [Streptomyces sp. NPDC086023]|uniref:bifunctional DNA primase/polymerase n=1 Tax=Streptomyces sp. NPDC086023 TaxID=3365746 RepID=UPI0037D674F1
MARWFAAEGRAVHPLAPGSKVPARNCARCRAERHPPAACPCRSEGRWCHGFHAATTDTAVVDHWWGLEPGFGVGVACGPSRLVVIDVDVHPAAVPGRDRLLPGIAIDPRVDLSGLASGFDTLALLAALRSRPDPAHDRDTLRVATPSGGLHIWYARPPGVPRLRSSSGSGAGTALAWQVDVRADGGYIVAPGTRTAEGAYTPLPGARRPAPLPDWLAAELLRTGHGTAEAPASAPPERASRPGAAHAPARPGGGPAGHAARLLDSLLAEVRGCGAGPSGMGFTEKLNRAAYTAAGLAAAGHLSDTRCRALLAEAAAQARPHQQRRNRSIIESAYAAGIARPIHPKGCP